MSALDANDVVRHLREQASIEYGRMLVDNSILRAETELIRKVLLETMQTVTSALDGPEDSHTLVLKQLAESLAKWNQ